jgi:hypothetical protein
LGKPLKKLQLGAFKSRLFIETTVNSMDHSKSQDDSMVCLLMNHQMSLNRYHQRYYDLPTIPDLVKMDEQEWRSAVETLMAAVRATVSAIHQVPAKPKKTRPPGRYGKKY